VSKEHYIPRGFIRSRPIRVAFLVEDGQDSGDILDAVFANCHARWGGRHSLVVPCENSKPREAWLPWLTAYDPDIIYCYTSLDKKMISDLHEKLGPLYLTIHEYDERLRGERYFRTELPIKCLTSISAALRYGRASPPSDPRPMFVVDYSGQQGDDRFIDDNFGTIRNSLVRWPLPDSLSDVVRTISLGTEGLLAGRPPEGASIGEVVPDKTALLNTMSKILNSCGIAQLAGDAKQSVDIKDIRHENFSLIIGNEFVDRILFWNQYSLRSPGLGYGFTTLIVPVMDLRDNNFFNSLVAFLRMRNGAKCQSNSWIEVKSGSISGGDLEKICRRLRGAGLGNVSINPKSISLDCIVPDAKAVGRAVKATIGFISGKCSAWKEFQADGEQIRPPVTLPDPLIGTQVSSRATDGAWALDLDLERKNNLSQYMNVQHRWRFPRRLRMHRYFCNSYEDVSVSYSQESRSTREGFLSIFCGFGEDLKPIYLPEDDYAIRFALMWGCDWMQSSDHHKNAVLSGPYGGLRPSDKGRYLIGALTQFGGIANASEFLLHNYWKTIFATLGGAIAADRHEEIKKNLKRRIRNCQICSEDEWNRLSKIVSREAHQIRMHQNILSFTELEKAYKLYLEEKRQTVADQQREDIEEDVFDQSLPHSVRSLCERSVLHQGYEWRCPICCHLNWNQIDGLRSQVACDVCAREEPVPVNKPWDF